MNVSYLNLDIKKLFIYVFKILIKISKSSQISRDQKLLVSLVTYDTLSLSSYRLTFKDGFFES